MKVNRISLWSIDLTSHETYYMAEGKTCDTVKTHVLCLDTDTGLKGWWQCENGHIYKARVVDKTSKQGKCLHCPGKGRNRKYTPPNFE